jgi:diguanylate cyclase (GGDEF)-like protein
MSRSAPELSRTSAFGLACLTLGAVAWMDFATGAEVRFLALYFVPLLIAGWHLGRRGIVVFTILAAMVWVGVLYGVGIRFDGTHHWVINALATGVGFLTVSLLVGFLRSALDREQALARTDPLTGLSNRRELADRVASELALCKRAGRAATLVLIDLNDFKLVNDSLGHQGGDDVLRTFAGILSKSVRASDSVARIGGDEFVIFMPDTDADQAEQLVDRVRSAAASASLLQSSGVTLSVGVHSEDPAASDLGSMLTEADALMYDAKRRRKAAIEPEPGKAEGMRQDTAVRQ